MPLSSWPYPPDPQTNPEEFKDYILELHNRVYGLGEDTTGDLDGDNVVGGAGLPVADTQTIVKGSADATKLLRFEVDGLTTGTTRVLTVRDNDYAIADITQAETITGDWTFNPNGTGGITDFDIEIGDTDGTPTYGIIHVGDAIMGRTSYNVGNIDLDGAMLYRNNGGPVTGQVEHIFTEATGNTCRFALPKSGVGNATYNPRSMLIAGPAPADTDFVTVGYWQTNNSIFDNLACDTAGAGADLGVQNDLEVEGDIFTDSIKESTSAAGITFANDTITSAGRIANTDRYTSNQTLNSANNIVLGDTDGGAFTITLPAGVDGTHYKISNVGSSGNTLTLTPDGSELLVGANANFDLFDGETLDLSYETTEGWVA